MHALTNKGNGKNPLSLTIDQESIERDEENTEQDEENTPLMMMTAMVKSRTINHQLLPLDLFFTLWES